MHREELSYSLPAFLGLMLSFDMWECALGFRLQKGHCSALTINTSAKELEVRTTLQHKTCVRGGH